MKKYVVMHDWGCYEGWKIVAEADELADAVQMREKEIESGIGGLTVIFQYLPPVEAYSHEALKKK